ncbi:MAG TPA: hypothetical protein DC010_06695 [Psychrobacter sp.]|nr:hypothetical protein [Psychrobacter sp.]HBL97499.1 hypothetical protein [Psychrobacter sp.]
MSSWGASSAPIILKLKFRLIYHKTVIQERVLAPTVAVTCWFGRVVMARFWGVDAKQATTQTVANATPRLADTSGRREIAPNRTKTQTQKR